MATNQFKAFATAESANVTSQDEWEELPALLSGFQSGKASAAQVNKALRQATFVAAALAQYISDKNNADVLDDGDIAAFITSLSSALGKDFQPLSDNLTALAALTGDADRMPYFTGANEFALATLSSVGRSIIGKATTSEVLAAIAGAPLASPTFTGEPKAPTPEAGDNDTSIATTAFVTAAIDALSFGTASQRNVGTGTNQIPDMNSFSSSLGATGWEKLPSGKIKQWGYASTASGSATSVAVTFPIAFPTACIGVSITPQISAALSGDNLSMYFYGQTTTGFTMIVDASSSSTGSRIGYYEAIGY